MSRIINRAESWEIIYNSFSNINFSSFDYEVVKQSLIDYLKIYYPENFNDYIENSELISILEMFSYIAELLAYRIDVNSQENFLTTAQRKQSVLRLAKLISYNPTRNIPARALVKITSVSSSENIFDADGVNLINKTIFYNDPNNIKWKEQFFLVMDKILNEEFGNVSPSDRIQIDDTIFELYQLKEVQSGLQNGVFSYNINVSNTSISMELVPIALDSNGPYERRPDLFSTFSIVYLSDGLGDASQGTGFFFLTKQGSLTNISADFDGLTPNQTFLLDISNINNTDVWINNVDSDTGEILDDGSVENGRSGEWQQVDISNSQNIIFNTNENRNKYEIQTLEDDKILIVYGDGEFANIPSGKFDIWFRTSLNENIVIPQKAINEAASFTYFDINNNIQTFGFSFTLTSSIQNASVSEDIEGIRRNAPSVYYSQDRMVNGRDYNTFMLQDPSILKLRSINRTFAGDSKYIFWHDPKESYENVKLFSDDLAIYFNKIEISFQVNNKPIDEVLDEDIVNLLQRMDVFLAISLLLQNNPTRNFTTSERTELLNILNSMSIGDTAYLIHSPYIIGTETLWWKADATPSLPRPDNAIIRIEQISLQNWEINFYSQRLIAESNDTKFWNINSGETVVTYDTLQSTTDKIILLKANENRDRNNLLLKNLSFEVLSHILIPIGIPNTGLPNIHQLSILPSDENLDTIPDGVNLSDLFNPNIIVNSTGSVTLPINYINGKGDITVIGNGSETWNEDGVINSIVNTITVTSLGTNVSITIIVKDYVYFYRETNLDVFKPIEQTIENVEAYIIDVDNINYKRETGRYPLNFLWMHKSSAFHLIDPSASNIIDSFLITRGYYINVKNWVDGITDEEPASPTAQQLRQDYANLLDNKMISDTVILHPGRFKILFGALAQPELQATFKVIRSSSKRLTDTQIKSRIVTVVRNFFDISKWEYGETFYFTELATLIHESLNNEINSVVLVPNQSNNYFGDLFQISAREDEIFIANISTNNIEIVDSYNKDNINQK